MGKRMLAVVYHGPLELRVEERLVPQIQPAEVLLRVVAASICSTDLRILHGGHRMFPPGTVRILGHEVIGDIAEVGGAVKDLAVGKRVFVAPNIGCGQCRQCLTGNGNLCPDYQAIGVTIDGAFAEYVRIPEAAVQRGNLIPLGEQAGSEATLIEPLACVLRGQDAVGVSPDDDVLVIGAGPIGLMHVKAAKLRGARRVFASEVIPERLGQAGRMGADRVINPERDDLAEVIAEETHGKGADVVIVAAPSHAAQASALELAGIGGRINYFGGLLKDRPEITINSNLIHYKELTVTGTTGSSTADCWRAAAAVESGQINLSGLVSAHYPLGQAVEAFAAAEERKALKIVLQPA